MTQNPTNSIDAGSITEDNFFEWEAAITRPEGTYFEDDVFIAKLELLQDYPLCPQHTQDQVSIRGRREDRELFKKRAVVSVRKSLDMQWVDSGVPALVIKVA